MKKPVLGSIILIYLATGFGGVFFSYRNSSTITREKIQTRLIKMQIEGKTTKEILGRLPVIFREYPSAAMVLVLNQKKKLLGSLYEPDRVSQAEYNEILKTYKITEIYKFNYTRVVTSSGNSIWVIGNKRLGIIDYITGRLEANPYSIIFYGLYTLVLLVMLAAWVFDKPIVSIENQKLPPDIPDLEIHPGRKFQHTSEKYLENKIVLLLDTIEKSFSTSKVTFYSREGGKWRHILEKSGNLVVKGDVAIQYLPVEITGIADKNWREPLISHDKRILFIPLNYRSNLFGLLRIQFSELASEVTTETLNKLVTLCSNYSHTIFMQRIYDKAISDPETDFFNYPYFYFMIKEKLSADKKFAIVVFEISGFDRVSPESTRFWALELKGELEQNRVKPSILVRLERSRFSLLYDIGSKSDEIENLGDLNKVPPIIKNITNQAFNKTAVLNGGFFIRPSGFEDTDTFMQRLDYLLINSKFSTFSMDFNEFPSISGLNSGV